MTRRLRTLIASAALATAFAVPLASATAASPTAPGWSWAAPAMRDLVTRHGWPSSDQTPLGKIATRRELARALAELMRARGQAPPAGLRRPPDIPATDPDATAIAWVADTSLVGSAGARFSPSATVTGTTAESALVRILGLDPQVTALSRLHTTVGQTFRLPTGFAASILVAELGLRHNYPLGGEPLATATTAPLPLAELVGMVDGAIHMPSWRVWNVTKFSGIVLPGLSANQRTVIQNALTEVGQPYVWGGTSPASQRLWGLNLPGGFDCSGLVWWAYKLAPGTAGLGTDIVGRTADNMAWERPAERIALSKMRPGDLVFFGTQGAATPRGQIGHVGIYLGNGWMVHSNGSSDGTTITNLATWWPSAMAWARRPAAMRTGTTAQPTTVTTPAPPASHPSPPSAAMNRTLWRALDAFIHTHYAPRFRARAWASLSAHPDTAAAVLGRQMTHARWVALHQFIANSYAPTFRPRVWANLTAHPAAAYGALFMHGLL